MFFKPTNDDTESLYRRCTSRMINAIKRSRGQMVTPLENVIGHLESFFIDDTFLSLLFFNHARVSDKVWRSAQPHPTQVAALAKKGIKTIVNLRGKRDCASYHLEERACRKYGIQMVDLPMESRRPPRYEIIEQAAQVFSQIEYPALIHCKAGADRAGIGCALYLLLHENQPAEVAAKQLSLRYLHVRQSKTGVLDLFVETYGAFKEKNPSVDFLTWTRTGYDREAIMAAHKTKSFAEWLYNRALHRE